MPSGITGSSGRGTRAAPNRWRRKAASASNWRATTDWTARLVQMIASQGSTGSDRSLCSPSITRRVETVWVIPTSEQAVGSVAMRRQAAS